MGIFNLSQGQLYRKCTSLKCSVKLTVFLVSTGNCKQPEASCGNHHSAVHTEGGGDGNNSEDGA